MSTKLDSKVELSTLINELQCSLRSEVAVEKNIKSYTSDYMALQLHSAHSAVILQVSELPLRGGVRCY